MRAPLALGVLLAAGCTLDFATPNDGGAIDARVRDGALSDARDGAPPPPPLDGARESDLVTVVCDPTARMSTVGTIELTDQSSLTFDGTELEPPGQVALRAQPYRYGGLLVSGYPNRSLGATPSIAALDGIEPAGSAFIGDINYNFSGSLDAPNGLGVRNVADRYALLARGEIRLEAGPQSLTLYADDRGVLEVDVAGSTYRAIVAESVGIAETSFDVPAAGWYPIRIAADDTGGGSGLGLVRGPVLDGNIVERRDLRTDVAAFHGAELVAYDHPSVLGVGIGDRIDTSSSARDFGLSVPTDVGLVAQERWGARWVAGALLAAEDSTLHVVSDDSHRVFLDGVFLGGAYGIAGDYDVRYAIPSSPGRRDLVSELDDLGGNAHLVVTRAPAEAAIAIEAHRPFGRFGGRSHANGRTFATRIEPGGSTIESIDLPTPSNLAASDVVVVELSCVVETSTPDGVSLVVRAGTAAGAPRTFTMRGDGIRATGDTWHLRAVLTGSALGGGDGPWTLEVVNAALGGVATLRAIGAVGHVFGIEEPYPREGSATSVPRDLGQIVRVVALAPETWTGFGTSVEVLAHAGRSSAEIAAAPFVEADETTGALASPIEGRFVEVRVTLRGPGHSTPRVRSVGLLGSVCERP